MSMIFLLIIFENTVNKHFIQPKSQDKILDIAYFRRPFASNITISRNIKFLPYFKAKLKQTLQSFEITSPIGSV